MDPPGDLQANLRSSKGRQNTERSWRTGQPILNQLIGSCIFSYFVCAALVFIERGAGRAIRGAEECTEVCGFRPGSQGAASRLRRG